ncbi:conserved hypothetical protein [Parafrankia sp. Ea1.12]|uniref:hypothetical protein n=1 Tax=Parafrankia sp. Ea1.12 TaxID=573499 RepID=UPI000DA505A3|nr:hypothetical protein [Parafrankia sp. Ea1.12]SQD96279.1 conserved hypothetical protein [Parafrankia sp. Ea1.12]
MSSVDEVVRARALATVARHARDADDLALLAEALDLPLGNEGGGSGVPAAYAGLAAAILASGDGGEDHTVEVGAA